MDWIATYQDAADRARMQLDDGELALVDAVQHMHDRYYGLERDERLAFPARTLLSSIATRRAGKVFVPGKKRIITIYGEPNAGKTRALVKHFVKARELQPYTDENGNEINPLLMFAPPSPCTPRLIALEGLKALGINAKIGGEGEAWDAFRTALKAHKITVVCIDEAQDAITTANVTERDRIANALKQTTQMPDWPLVLVLAGTSPLDHFMAMFPQLVERNYPVPFEPLDLEQGLNVVSDTLPKIVESFSDMTIDSGLFAPQSDFAARLLHASSHQFGTLVQKSRDAVEWAAREGNKVLNVTHFAAAYAAASGCRPSENVFTQPGWQSFNVQEASVRTAPPRWKEPPKDKKQKDLKFGERP